MKGNKAEKMRAMAVNALVTGFVVIWITFVLCAVAGLIWGLISLGRAVWLRPAKTMAADTPCEGVGRVPTVERYLGGDDAEAVPSLWVVCEDDPDLPEWWDPDGAVLVYTDAPKKDIGCPDWNVNTTFWGWDGHGAEAWELELLARVFYLEFWGCGDTLCEAGIDAILRLWESEYYSASLGGTLAGRNEDGSWAFSTYPEVWQTEYDPDGLAWCRAYTAERFQEGPVWTAPYFRTEHYHDTRWAVPAYRLENVYFSVGRW